MEVSKPPFFLFVVPLPPNTRESAFTLQAQEGQAESHVSTLRGPWWGGGAPSPGLAPQRKLFPIQLKGRAKGWGCSGESEGTSSWIWTWLPRWTELGKLVFTCPGGKWPKLFRLEVGPLAVLILALSLSQHHTSSLPHPQQVPKG